jgi:GNAT superfamily N-acetyltransferase
MTDPSHHDGTAPSFEPPPRQFDDGEDRVIDIQAYGEALGDADAADPPAEGDAEFEALVEMYEAFDPEDRAQGIPPVKEPAIRDWLNTILDGDCVNVVAWHDEAAIGHATLVPAGDDSSELAIFVLGSHQGAGIGTELITALLGQGQREGIGQVWLTVERWNDPAVALYRKVGFEPRDTKSFELEMAIELY